MDAIDDPGAGRRYSPGAVLAATLCLTLLWSLPCWAQRGAPKPVPAGRLLITGSTTMAPLVTEIAQRFEALYPAIKVEVRAGGSGKGISDLRAGTSSIGMASRVLLDSEKDLYAFPIARDGVALIVHQENPVRGLTAPQALDIITGRTANWKTLGGRDAAIMLIWRARGQGAAELLAERLGFKEEQVRAHATIVDNDALAREVQGNPAAIAAFSVGEAQRRMKAGARIRMLSFAGVPAAPKTIRNGSYVLSRPLMLVTRILPTGAERSFVDFALSGHVADLFRKYDFVSYEE